MIQTTSVGARTYPGYASVAGRVILETTLPPRGRIAHEIERGQIMRVVDLEGRQVGDLVAFNRANLAEKFWISNTVRLNGTVFVTTGHVLYSELSNPMFTILADTCGRHDLLAGSCNAEIDKVRYGVDEHYGCVENFLAALAPYRIERKDIPMSLNLFMNCPVTPDFTLALQQIQNNTNELNKQVTYLIVFNSFAPFENTNNSGINPFFGEFTYNTISGLLFGKVNEQLNRIFSKILRNNNATFSFTGSLYNRNVFDQNARGSFKLPNQTNIGLNLGLPLFNDRAHFTIGGTVDVPLQSDFEQSIRLFPDVSLELLVNKSGSVKATFFYRQNVDFLTGNAPGSIVPRRYGASIGYGKDFNSIGELFGKKKIQKDSLQKTPVDTTGTQ